MKILVNEIKQINLEIDGRCNLKCPMCLHSIREKDFLVKLPLKEFYNIIDQAIPFGLKYVNIGGSGEPLLHRGLEKAVAYLTKNNITSMIYTNGTLLTPNRFKRLCQAGLSIFKVSCQGWDRESYAKWMSVDSFDRVRSNLQLCLEILRNNSYPSKLQTNHIIQDYGQCEYQKDMYIKNWIKYLSVKGEIWLAHNWAGLYNNNNIRRDIVCKGRTRRTCGRAMGKIIEIRAGGLKGKKGAVVPCPNVLGQDSKAVMGHTQDTPLIKIINNKKMLHWRDVHFRETFDEIDYCKNCDQLFDIPEALVWTNIKSRVYGQSCISGINYVNSEK